MGRRTSSRIARSRGAGKCDYVYGLFPVLRGNVATNWRVTCRAGEQGSYSKKIGDGGAEAAGNPADRRAVGRSPHRLKAISVVFG